MKKLSESFVDDIIRRGITGEDRQEDSVDLLGMKEMYDYICKHYEFVEHLNAWPMKSYSNSGAEFMVPLFFNENTKNTPFHLVGTYQGDMLVKLVLQADSADCADIMGSLNKKFYLTSLGYMGMKIRDKQGKVSNKLCLDFIDTVIENVKNPLMKKIDSVDESFVDDIIRRGITGEDRQEDNVNILSLNEFREYLMNLYEYDSTDFKFKSFLHQFKEELIINLAMGYWLCVNYENDSPISSSFGNRLYIDTNAPKLIDTLKTKYELGETAMGNSILIKSKITNQDIIRIIDIMIECAKNNISVHRKEI